MTSINVSKSVVYVDVTSNGTTTVVKSPAAPVVIDVVTVGPQGGAAPNQTFASLLDVDATGTTDQAVVYYSAASAKFKADGTNTILSLTDGGNF
jgi:hypothetical protein